MALPPRTPLWASLALLALLLPALLLAGCGPPSSSRAQSSRGGTTVVVFLDFSASIQGEDRGIFQRELETQIVPFLAPGDRFLVAPIDDRTLTGFRPLVDASLPPRPQFNGWMDNTIKFQREAKEIEARVAKTREEIKTQVVDIFGKTFRSQHTDIFSSLVLAEKLFYNDRRLKVLVLMSDMIEDSTPYRFDRMAWTPETTDQLLSDLESKGLIAKLPGVCVYVSGASAASAELAAHIGRFWQAYFERAGADVDPSRYAHVLLHWPPSKSCRSVQTALKR